MKTLLIGILFLAGCTNTTQETAETRPEPGKKSYSAEQLRKTGRENTGGALEEVDPSIRTTRDGR